MTALTVVGIQADLAWEDRDANLAMFAEQVDRAVAIGADLVVLPEMFPTGFSMNTAVTAEPADGPSATFLVESASRTGAWQVGSFACLGDGPDERPTNRLLLAAPDGTTHNYDKVHPFSYAGEDDHFAPGRTTGVVDVGGVRVAPFVCYDLRFANVFWDLGPEADLFVVPANWPSPRREHWRTLLRARAIENQAWVVGLNRVGVGRTIDGRDLPYSGDSMVVDPLGQVVAAAADQPTLVTATVDTDRVTEVRDRFRFLPDRRFSTDL